jgi:hypothetical protein
MANDGFEVSVAADPVSVQVVVSFRFGTGYKKDTPDDRDRPAHAMLGAAVRLPAECLGLRAKIRRIKNQQTTESCVGQALCTAVDTRLRFLGFDLPEPSSLGAYVVARKVGGETILDDQGCSPRDAMKGARDIGLPDEAAWPFDPALVNVEPPRDVLENATRHLLLQWYRIYQTGASLADEIANAVSKNYPVIFGLELDAAFFDYAGGTIAAMNADKRGGHMLCCLGYRTDADGKRAFLVVNSWDESWGENGCCWISEDVFATDRVSDPHAIEVSP